MTLRAKYPGTCASAACTKPIKVGEPVTFVDRELVHDRCVGDVGLPAPITRAVCGECFTEVAISGGCLC